MPLSVERKTSLQSPPVKIFVPPVPPDMGLTASAVNHVGCGSPAAFQLVPLFVLERKTLDAIANRVVPPAPLGLKARALTVAFNIVVVQVVPLSVERKMLPLDSPGTVLPPKSPAKIFVPPVPLGLTASAVIEVFDNPAGFQLPQCWSK